MLGKYGSASSSPPSWGLGGLGARAGIATESELLSQQQVLDYYEVGGRTERRHLVSLLGILMLDKMGDQASQAKPFPMRRQ